jgi:hypothetical protein
MPIIMLPLWGDSNQIDDLDVGIGRYTRFGVRYLVTNGDRPRLRRWKGKRRRMADLEIDCNCFADEQLALTGLRGQACLT